VVASVVGCVSAGTDRRKEAFDGSATPTVGVRLKEARKLSAVDLERLWQRMAVATERAMREDPREVRWRMAELEWERKPQVAIGQVEVPVLRPGQLKKS
jgi:hypothetical protein